MHSLTYIQQLASVHVAFLHVSLCHLYNCALQKYLLGEANQVLTKDVSLEEMIGETEDYVARLRLQTTEVLCCGSLLLPLPNYPPYPTAPECHT